MPFGVVAAVLAVLLSTCGPGAGSGAGPAPGKNGEFVPAGPRLGWGFTHTQYSADSGSEAARQRAEQALADATPAGLPQNQHLMGWGAQNPEPAPGRYDFASLDSRIDLIRRSGGIPVITLCCAPDWMKGGTAGETDWDELETAPLPEHYDDFAALAARVAQRYPDVRHFLVWNEFKGFYDEERGRWDHEGYTELYNLVQAAVKKVRPDSRIGGPYLVLDSVARGGDDAEDVPSGAWGGLDPRTVAALRYWNRHKADADFVVVDGSNYTRDGQARPDEFGASEKFAAVGEWVRELTGLPLWWAEWYVEPGDEDDARAGWSEPHRLAVQAVGMAEIARGGAATALYWNPQRQGTSCPGCLWRDTDTAGGGAPLPMLELLGRFAAEFPPGTRFEEVPATGSRAVRVLADADTVLLVNTSDAAVTAEVDGRAARLGPYEVRWRDR